MRQFQPRPSPLAAVLEARHVVAAGVARPNHGRPGLAARGELGLVWNVDGIGVVAVEVLAVLAAGQRGVLPLVGPGKTTAPAAAVTVPTGIRDAAAETGPSSKFQQPKWNSSSPDENHPSNSSPRAGRL